MSAYYNEFDPFAAAWLRELIKGGHIAPGDVDERSITEVKSDELKGYTQCHFFAGIGGWSHALRLAGWADDAPVWTGSCPCQPFSTAGNQKGKADERHLWPVWFELIKAVQPATIFGEQVASAIGHGWLDDVAEDLESVRFTDNRENMHRLQDPETFDRVSEILWQIKRGRTASLQDLPTGIREEVAQFIVRIQKGATSETQSDRQDLSPKIQLEKQGSLLGFRDTPSLPEKGNSVRSVGSRRGNSKSNRWGILRGQRVPIEQDHLCGTGVQHPINRQDRPETGIYLQQHSDRGICSQCSDGRLGRGDIQTNHAKMDGEINAEQKPCIAGTSGSQSETGFAHGWLDDVYQGLEGEGYAVGAAVLPACGVGAPHKRDRLFFVGYSEHNGSHGGSFARSNGKTVCHDTQGQDSAIKFEGASQSSNVANSECFRQSGSGEFRQSMHTTQDENGETDWLNYVGAGRWEDGHWIDCPDGKQRLIEPSICLLAHGVSNRVGKLRGYGNAIVAPLAAEFIKAYMEI